MYASDVRPCSGSTSLPDTRFIVKHFSNLNVRPVSVFSFSLEISSLSELEEEGKVALFPWARDHTMHWPAAGAILLHSRMAIAEGRCSKCESVDERCFVAPRYLTFTALLVKPGLGKQGIRLIVLGLLERIGDVVRVSSQRRQLTVILRLSKSNTLSPGGLSY